MDLLQHYDSSSSDDDDDKSQKKRPAEDCTATSYITADKRPTRGSVTIVSDRDAVSQSLFVRAQPHVRGNWAGHVFVRIPISTTTVPSEEESSSSSSSSSSDDESGTVSSWQSAVNQSVATYRNDLERAGYTGTLVQHTQHCHLSLSRPFYLQVASIDSFVDQLTARLQLCPVTTIRILSGNNNDSSNILVNEDCSRSFWTWPIQHTVELLQMVQAVNVVLQSYHQPVYYDPPHFHLSLASFVADTGTAGSTNTDTDTVASLHQDLPKRMRQLATQTSRSNDEDDNDKGMDATTSSASTFYFPWTISEIQCTFGTTKSYTIPLASSSG